MWDIIFVGAKFLVIGIGGGLFIGLFVCWLISRSPFNELDIPG
ncbi:unnamed protein product [marine sediment metagenome]|uniref:Uncharacterized protein n=1 Tax=marine sediment metagenome TaxID=412755 RepID=X0VIM0_9ZZZZ